MKVRRRTISILLLVVFLMMVMGCTSSVSVLASPRHPPVIRLWQEKLDANFVSGLERFSFQSAQVVLSESERQKNALYSPLSLYMALSLATQSACGETQQELLDVLCMNDANLMREKTGKLYRNLYHDGLRSKLTLANSLWLSKDVKFHQAFLNRAAKDYYADIFWADFADSALPGRISKWVQKHTEGKLGGDPSDVQPDGVMLLLNTLYFKDQWAEEFNKNNTHSDTFYLADGKTVSCDFMHAEYEYQPFARTTDCTVSALSFKGGQQMVFVLPNEGISPYDIASDPKRLKDAFCALSNGAEKGDLFFTVPKFEFKKKTDLISSLADLGVRKAFDPQYADFSALSDTKPLFIRTVEQSTAVTVNENGAELAAVTSLVVAASASGEQVYMTLDRPFLFAILGGAGDAPLFIGIVNDPTAQ